MKPRFVFCKSSNIILIEEDIEENSLQIKIINMNSTGQHILFSPFLIKTQLKDKFLARSVSN